MNNPYKDIYPHADWSYTYECPECCEPVPLEIDKNSAPFYRELIGQCQNCKLDIRISEEDFEEWRLNQKGELSQGQDDFVSDNHRYEEEEKEEEDEPKKISQKFS